MRYHELEDMQPFNYGLRGLLISWFCTCLLLIICAWVLSLAELICIVLARQLA